jgi:hypothetical protein
MRSGILSVNIVPVSTSFLEAMEDRFGKRRTSSNVNPFDFLIFIILSMIFNMNDTANAFKHYGLMDAVKQIYAVIMYFIFLVEIS